MQCLDDANNTGQSDLDCAALVIDTLLLGFRTIKSQMDKSKPRELSVQQFRTLAVLSHHGGASLSQLAGHMGLTASTACRAVGHLVAGGLVERQRLEDDRRTTTLSLTDEGARVYAEVQSAAKCGIATMMRTLPPEDRISIQNGMTALRAILVEHWQDKCGSRRGQT